MLKPNVLIISPTKIGLTETFIRAHIERLNANVTYIYGYYLTYATDQDIPLKQLYQKPKNIWDRIKSMLPHFLYFKFLQKDREATSDSELIKRFMKDQKIDLVLAEYGTAGSFITPVCEALDIPLLVHFHGFDAARYKTLKGFKLGYQAMFGYASKIIVVSKAMKKALINEGCPEEKLVLNTYGPHPDYFNVTPDYGSNHIVGVGRHTYKKAPYLTILAFQKVLETLPNLKLTLIGTGELYEVCKHMIEALDLQESISIPGGLPREEMIPYLQKSCLFIQHSLVAGDGDSEGTPVGIIEAMAAGLPVVSTYHAGIPDVVENRKTGLLVEEGDINAMAQAIIELVSNRDILETYGMMGRIKIEQDYTMEKHIQKLNAILTETLFEKGNMVN